MAAEPATWRSSLGRRARQVLNWGLGVVPGSVRRRVIPVLRYAAGFQISARAVEAARDHLVGGGRLLVFGLGLDSATWNLVNRHGRTVFLEDVAGWIDIARAEAPDREVYEISYSTTVTGSLGYDDSAEIPRPSLPDVVTSFRWDVVVVDGPYGWGNETPGRASSIALARDLVASGGIVIVDDYNREVERHSCDLVFARPPDRLLDQRRPVALFRC